MTFIHPTALIGNNVQIGDNVYIGAYCIIGSAPEWKGKEGQDKGVIIHNGARLTGLVTVDAGAERPTIIGENCYLMKHSYVAHDVQLGDGVVLSSGVKIGGHSTIEKGTNLGMNAVVHQKVTVPAGCMIGASAFIGKKTEMKPNSKYAGVPAKYIGENIR